MAKVPVLELEARAKAQEILEQNQKTILFMLEAKEWSECIDCLKKSVDSMYDICQLRQNVFGCEEALIYLQKAVNDFTKLIESIRVEREWDTLDKTAAWEIKGSSQHMTLVNKKREETAWQLVTNGRSKRKKSSNASSQEDVTSQKGAPSSTTPTKPTTPLANVHSNVYNRLAYGKRACNTAPVLMSEPSNLDTILPTSKSSHRNCSSPCSNGRFMAPRSAMDLPQTRASMAKMAYSRQLLWQQRKKQLAEKLMARQRHEHAMANSRRRRSLPSLVKISATSVPLGKKVVVQALKEVPLPNPSTSIPNLESINESAEEEELEDGASSTKTMAGKGGLCSTREATSRLVYMTRSEPPPASGNGALDLSEDEEWRAMTEEEESLAQEEESLKKEIEEEESLSIDDEIQRRASSMDRSFDMFENDEEERPGTYLDPNISQAFHVVPPSGWRPTWKETVSKWAVATDSEHSEDNLSSPKKASLKTEAKNDISVEAEEQEVHPSASRLPVLAMTSLQPSQQYRRPGELALFRAKLLSPSRKKISDDKQLEERQQKAEEVRLQLQEDKSNRLRELHQKVEEVKRKREEITERKRLHLEQMEQRMKKAEENRQRNLGEIIRKMKEDQQKVLEITFINTLDAENVKHGMTESHVRVSNKVQKRMDTMAKERALKVEQKAAKETAAEERRKKAEQQRMERLRETTTRKKERLTLAEAQRHEQAELLKQRARQREHKLEQRKATDLHETKSLLTRIQQKHEDSSRRHEESLEQVKLKAVEMCSPRPLQSWVTLADFSQIPSDVDYTIVVRRCTLCELKLTNDLQLISHICSDKHLNKACAQNQRDIYDALVDYEFLKDQLEDCIKEVDLEDDDIQPFERSNLAEMTQDENVEPCSSEATFDNISCSNGTTPMAMASPKCMLALKKKKTKLKQKLNKYADDTFKPSEVGLVSTETKKPLKIDKKLRDLMILLKEAQPTDAQKTLIERSIAETHKNFSQISKTEAAKLALDYQRSGLIEALVGFLAATNSHQSPGSARIFFKSIHLMTNMLQSNSILAETLFSTSLLIQLCDLFMQKVKISQSDQATCLLNIIQLILSSLINKVSSNQISERVYLLAQYLSLCGLDQHLKQLLSEATCPSDSEVDKKSDDKTPKGSIEIGKDLNINKLDVVLQLINKLICLATTSSHREDTIVQLSLNSMHPLVHTIYTHFLGLQALVQGGSTPRAGADMTTSMISSSTFGAATVTEAMNTSMMTTSTNSSTKLVLKAAGLKGAVMSGHMAEKLMNWMLELWNSIASCASSNAIIQTLFSSEPNGSFPFRLSYIFQCVLNYCIKEWSSSNAKQKLLNKSLQAVGYFASKAGKQSCCVY
uniref:S phase cyclin A-associated protein in the endoplasmic reticulum N-terminal domain-containing protein n=1 Tax=Ditylenchus dipsaci TaxID=166011 RepID=A0A915D4G7_9BILA